jgi:hypothetical protein
MDTSRGISVLATYISKDRGAVSSSVNSIEIEVVNAPSLIAPVTSIFNYRTLKAPICQKAAL